MASTRVSQEERANHRPALPPRSRRSTDTSPSPYSSRNLSQDIRDLEMGPDGLSPVKEDSDHPSLQARISHSSSHTSGRPTRVASPLSFSLQAPPLSPLQTDRSKSATGMRPWDVSEGPTITPTRASGFKGLWDKMTPAPRVDRKFHRRNASDLGSPMSLTNPSPNILAPSPSPRQEEPSPSVGLTPRRTRTTSDLSFYSRPPESIACPVKSKAKGGSFSIEDGPSHLPKSPRRADIADHPIPARPHLPARKSPGPGGDPPPLAPLTLLQYGQSVVRSQSTQPSQSTSSRLFGTGAGGAKTRKSSVDLSITIPKNATPFLPRNPSRFKHDGHAPSPISIQTSDGRDPQACIDEEEAFLTPGPMALMSRSQFSPLLSRDPGGQSPVGLPTPVTPTLHPISHHAPAPKSSPLNPGTTSPPRTSTPSRASSHPSAQSPRPTDRSILPTAPIVSPAPTRPPPRKLAIVPGSKADPIPEPSKTPEPTKAPAHEPASPPPTDYNIDDVVIMRATRSAVSISPSTVTIRNARSIRRSPLHPARPIPIPPKSPRRTSMGH